MRHKKVTLVLHTTN